MVPPSLSECAGVLEGGSKPPPGALSGESKTLYNAFEDSGGGGF